MSGVNFNLLQSANVAGAFNAGLDRGQQQRRQRDAQSALSAFVTNPDDPQAQQNALLHAPQQAANIMQTRHTQAEWKRGDDYRAAAGEYFAGVQPNALLATMPGGAAAGVPFRPGALNVAGGGAPGGGALSSAMPATSQAGAQMGAGALSDLATGAPSAAPQAQRPEPIDLNGEHDFHASAYGELDTQSAAFRKMMRADPDKAMAAMKETYGLMKTRIDVARTAYSTAYTQLAGVTDEASYQRVLDSVRREFAPLGVDVTERVPQNYPGPQGIQQLRYMALDADKALAATDRRARLEWDITDDEEDNERADRNIDSTIANRNSSMSDREARLGLAQQREARVASGRGRARGGSGGPGRAGRQPSPSSVVAPILQKVRDGQPLSANEQRAWEMYKPQRSTRGGRTGGGGGGGDGIRTITSPAEARALPPGTRFRTPDGAVKVR